MNPFEAAAMLGTFSIIGLTIFGITRAITSAWARRLPESSDSSDRILEAVERMQADVEALRADVAERMDEIEERMDFSEHLLAGHGKRRDPDSRSRVIGLTPT